MITPKSEFTLVVPEWKNKVEIGFIKTEYLTTKDRIPKKYKDCETKTIKNKKYLIDDKGKKIIKNPKKQGNVNYWNINGQDFYSTNMHWRTRADIVRKYKQYIIPFIKKQLPKKIPFFSAYTLDMKLYIYEVFSNETPDIINMWILPKIIEDAIVSCKVIPDDNPEYRRTAFFRYIFVEKEEDRKLVLKLTYIKNQDHGKE